MLRIKKFEPGTIKSSFWKGFWPGKLSSDMIELFGAGDYGIAPKADVATLGWFAVSVEANLGLSPAETARVNAATEAYKARMGNDFLGHVAVELDDNSYARLLGREPAVVLGIADEIAREEYNANKQRTRDGLPPNHSSPFGRARKLYARLHPGQTPPTELIAPPDLHSYNSNATYFFAEGADYPSAVNNMHGWLSGLGVMTPDEVGSSYPDVFGYANQLDLRQRWRGAMDASRPLAAARIMLENPERIWHQAA